MPSTSRRPHSGERLPARLHRREVHRHPVDGGRNAGVLENLPQRAALAHQLDAPTRERELPRAEAEAAPGRQHPVGGRVHLDRRRLAVQEVEHPVPAGVHAGDEVGPGDGAERRHARLEGGEAPFGGEAREVRKPPLVDEPLEIAGVHAVDAEHDDVPAARPAGRRAAGRDCGGRSPYGTEQDGGAQRARDGPRTSRRRAGRLHDSALRAPRRRGGRGDRRRRRPRGDGRQQRGAVAVRRHRHPETGPGRSDRCRRCRAWPR